MSKKPQMVLNWLNGLGHNCHAALKSFHPLIQSWFSARLGEPTEPQIRAWPLIQQGKNVLVAAPTGTGKTLTAFMSCIDTLIKKGLSGELSNKTEILYISPLKALGNDVQKNLMQPLEELRRLADENGVVLPDIRAKVRSGDTPAAERQALVRNPPHILITTPESLFLYLTSPRARTTLENVQTVIIDEIHAVARSKRGAHLALSIERLRMMLKRDVQLIGLSATQKPLEGLADFLVGFENAKEARRKPVELIQVGHVRPWDLKVEIPPLSTCLSAIASKEVWSDIYQKIEGYAATARTVLLFTNTRRLAERMACDLAEKLGEDKVSAHHGSMSKEARLRAEVRLKNGELKVMVATASLELGLDVGAIDLVCQIGSPRNISVMLQRLGRAGHHKLAISRGVLLPTTRDELLECVALKRAIEEKTLDPVIMPHCPEDVLAQQIVGEVASNTCDEEELFNRFTRASMYRELKRETFNQVVHMLSEGVSTRRSRARAHLHRDQINGTLKPRRGALPFALQNVGTIPDVFSVNVVVEPEMQIVGQVDEDFAIDSRRGNIFVLGSSSWRVEGFVGGDLRVSNAKGLPPSVPFWRGDALGRSDELSQAVANLRQDILNRNDIEKLLREDLGLSFDIFTTLVEYVKVGAAAFGNEVPTTQTLIAERFFNPSGGMELVIHAPLGSRINRAWGLALRKSFCRTFDFELQAAATDDAILLSLSEQHSFPLADIFNFVSENTAEHVVVQAVLQSPLFGTRFRWVSGRALALQRMRFTGRVPPPIQRAQSDDLLAAVFPAQVGCQDNHGGKEVEPPDHPLVNETLRECLYENMDIVGLKRTLNEMKTGQKRLLAFDVAQHSAFAEHILASPVYSFLDEAPLEERRVRAITLGRTLPSSESIHYGALDAQSIDAVLESAMPPVRSIDEWHDLLLTLAVVPLMPEWAPRAIRDTFNPLDNGAHSAALLAAGRAVSVRHFIAAKERQNIAAVLFPTETFLAPALETEAVKTREEALVWTLRGHMELLGPITAFELSILLSQTVGDIRCALAQLELEGHVIQGHFRPETLKTHLGALGVPVDAVEFCERRLLQRMQRHSIEKLRANIEPVSPNDYMRFLFAWHGLTGPKDFTASEDALRVTLLQLQGFEAPAHLWEHSILPARVSGYNEELLDILATRGDVTFCRLSQRTSTSDDSTAELLRFSKSGLLTLVFREELPWLRQAALREGPEIPLTEDENKVMSLLNSKGALFFTDLLKKTGLTPPQLNQSLWSLLARGRLTSDSAENVRALIDVERRTKQRSGKLLTPGRLSAVEAEASVFEKSDLAERVALQVLRRYGIVFRDLFYKEKFTVPYYEVRQAFRKLEMKGEIRGGRFIAGIQGEQFALPEAVSLSREIRKAKPLKQVVTFSGCDPLNLTSVLPLGVRVSSHANETLTFVDGCLRTVEAELAGSLARQNAPLENGVLA